MQNELQNFTDELSAIIGRPSRLRPFVCKGSPLACRVFIVGFNPATTVPVDFWQFWRPDYGFDRQAWFTAYQDERRKRPLSPDKTRRNSISNTRRVIEWILEAADPVQCLETNLYALPTEQAADLSAPQRLTQAFDFLADTIKPALIVTHGKDAEIHIRSKPLSAQVISVAHFSRGWSQQGARDLGAEIKAAVASRETTP